VRPHRTLSPLLVAAFLTLVPAPTPAQAAMYNGNCEPGETCLWMDANFANCEYDGWDEADFRKVHYATCRDKLLNDSATSYKNMTDDWYILSENPNGGGARYCIGPHATGNVQPAFNDKASSAGTVPADDVTPDAIRQSCKFVDTD